MSETAHTPGPWHADGSALGNIYIEAGKLDLAVMMDNRRGENAPAFPNARLMAAAPTLLEACNQAARFLEAIPDNIYYLIQAEVLPDVYHLHFVLNGAIALAILPGIDALPDAGETAEKYAQVGEQNEEACASAGDVRTALPNSGNSAIQEN